MSTETENDWSFYHGQEIYINNHLYVVVKAKELPFNLPAMQVEFRIVSENKIAPRLFSRIKRRITGSANAIRWNQF